MKPSNSAHKLLPLLPYVRAVLGSSTDRQAEFIGSGFLFKDDNNLFFITAAHVMDKQSKKFQLFIDRPNSGLVRIYGDAIVSNSTKDNRSDDQIDISIVKLDDEISLNLSETQYLTIDNFDLENTGSGLCLTLLG